MSDAKELLRRARDLFPPPEDVMTSLIRRRDRKVRNRRIATAVLALIIAFLSFASLVRVFAPAVERPAHEPRTRDIFGTVHGWIAYGGEGGIWAVDPYRPGDAEHRIRLSDRGGDPLAWSSDGSKLLILRQVPDVTHDPVADLDLFVLNADGTEARLTRIRDWISGGSFSPDGSEVVYAGSLSGPIYTVDSKGGTPQLLLARGRRWFPELRRSVRSWLYAPTFSPDGKEVAYFDGMGDWGHSLRVMNADGSGARVLVDNAVIRDGGHIGHLHWSPDGKRLAFDFEEGGIWVAGADGSGLMRVIANGVNPRWSPDGTHLSYQPIDPLSRALGSLEIAALDGTHVQKFGYARSGPWNPVPRSDAG
jgi:roadblock/LC7 domain-containing protein